jgi:Protein of unknown function (DUF3024)
MAFTELELKRIDKLIGGYCRDKTRPELADELRFVYEIEGQSVILAEERPDWRDPSKRMRNQVAKFRFVRNSRLWMLYWMRADLKWHRYEPAEPANDLADLLEVVDCDEYCAFFG